MKAIAIFNMDSISLEVQRVYTELRGKFPDIILERDFTKGLPLHMTVLSSWATDDIVRDTSVVKTQLFCFQGLLPKFKRAFPLALGLTDLALRLDHESYILTGNILKNQQLADSLGSLHEFSTPSHITLCHMKQSHGYESRDLIFPFFRKLASEADFSKLTYLPEIWTKTEGGIWEKFE